MALFTSKRERSLWLWALAVLVAIYSTLGPARALVDFLRERNLLRVSFGVLVGLVVVAILWHGTRKRPGWSEVGVGFGVALAYGVAFLRIANPAERTHLIEYGVVAVLMYLALTERGRLGRGVPAPAAVTVASTALLGLVDEGIQLVLPSRVFDWNDVLFNALAAFMAIVAMLALAPVRRPGWRLWFLWLVAGFVGWGLTTDPGSFGEGPSISIVPGLPSVTFPAFLSVAAGSILVGVFQWLVLRRYLESAILWVAAGLGAAVLGQVVVLGLGVFTTDLAQVAGVGMYGALAGMLQWLALRREVPGAGWWVLVSTVGWMVAIPVGDITGPPGWAIYSAITGAVLVVLLRGAPPREAGS